MSEEKKQTIKAELATFQQRFIAGLIDYAIVIGIIVVGVILQIAIGFVPVIGGWLSWILGLLFYVIGLAAAFYVFIGMPIKKDGQSFGKKQQNIQIAIIEDEAKTTVRPAGDGDLMPLILRYLLFAVDGILFGLVAWYFINNDPNRQRLGDQVAKTCVIVAPEGEPAK